MNSKPILLLSWLVLWAGLSIDAAPKHEASAAQSFYDRGMAVMKVDPGASLGLFIQAAKKGHVEAMVRLGYLYQTGSGTARNRKAALLWYTKAAAAGNTRVFFEIGNIYETGGNKNPPDYVAAIEWYEKGITHQSLKSCEALSRMYASGPDSAFHDGKKALKYASLLVRKDSGNATYFDLLAAAYARDIDFPNARKAAAKAISLSSLEEAPVRRERKVAYDTGQPFPAIATDAWIIEAARQDSMWAMMQLAGLHGDLLGAFYDPAYARSWYEKAAEDGNPDALLKLGHMCFHGEGGDVNMKKAFWCFYTASEAEKVKAYAPLARMYVGGKGTGQDFDKALEWYRKAIQAGLGKYNTQAKALKQGAGKISHLSPEELYAEAQRIISDDHVDKKGTAPTYSKKTGLIIPYVWLAAEQENTDAMKQLADMYYYGKRYFVRDGALDKNSGGIDPNYSRALDYYEQLTRRGIDCPEMESCKELYLIELKDRREQQLKKEQVEKRAAARAAGK